MSRKFPRYEDGLALLMGLTGAVVFFDRNAINFLSPFILKDLHLSYAQLGIASSIVALSWASAGFVVGRLSDKAGRRKPFLVVAIVFFSLCSAASGLAGGFIGLLAARLLMGLGEGPGVSLSIALVMDASTERRRGLNLGVGALLAGGLGSALSPLILVGLATHLGWRAAFFVAGLPGLVLAAAIMILVREAPRTAGVGARPSGPAVSRPLEVLGVRNVWLCALIATLTLASLSTSGVFLPLYLVQIRHLSVGDMALVLGIGGATGAFAAPLMLALSDHVGRRPLMVALSAAAAILPWGCLYWSGGVAGLAGICALGFLGVAVANFSIGMVPGESVDRRDRGSALGLSMGISEIVGGFASPALAGAIASRYGLFAALAMAGACSLGAMLMSLAVRETAPRRQPGVLLAAAATPK